ncbi:unnamed protein product [Urochloa humidicola]
MVLCIYGLPSNVTALQFEWAWQHPKESFAVRKADAEFKSFGGISNQFLSFPNRNGSPFFFYALQRIPDELTEEIGAGEALIISPDDGKGRAVWRVELGQGAAAAACSWGAGGPSSPPLDGVGLLLHQRHCARHTRAPQAPRARPKERPAAAVVNFLQLMLLIFSLSGELCY